jgi:hypothetical protein
MVVGSSTGDLAGPLVKNTPKAEKSRETVVHLKHTTHVTPKNETHVTVLLEDCRHT